MLSESCNPKVAQADSKVMLSPSGAALVQQIAAVTTCTKSSQGGELPGAHPGYSTRHHPFSSLTNDVFKNKMNTVSVNKFANFCIDGHYSMLLSIVLTIEFGLQDLHPAPFATARHARCKIMQRSA